MYSLLLGGNVGINIATISIGRAYFDYDREDDAIIK
mgnify:CR=1 FL=1